jgi:hypothetical protein
VFRGPAMACPSQRVCACDGGGPDGGDVEPGFAASTGALRGKASCPSPSQSLSPGPKGRAWRYSASRELVALPVKSPTRPYRSWSGDDAKKPAGARISVSRTPPGSLKALSGTTRRPGGLARHCSLLQRLDAGGVLNLDGRGNLVDLREQPGKLGPLHVAQIEGQADGAQHGNNAKPKHKFEQGEAV